jgi:hypothetical protein
MEEEVPANVASSGAVAGLIGEPPIRIKKKLRDF